MGHPTIHYLWVAIGSGVGGMARFACTGLGTRWFGETFPWGTLFVNIAGSLLIGVLAVAIQGEGRWLGMDARALFMVGACGGFTTFSSFSLQTLNLLNDGEYLQAGANIGLSVILCLAAVWAGSAVAASITALRWT